MRKLVIVSVAFLIVAAAVVWVLESEGLLPGYVEIHTRMRDASGLTDGSIVRMNGIVIGYLDRQTLTGSRDLRQKVQFDIKIRTRYLPVIPADSLIGVAAEDLLGNKSITIFRGTSSQPLQPGATLRSVEALDPNALMAQMGNEMQAFQEVANRANDILSGVDQGNGSVGKLVKNGAKEWDPVIAQAKAIQKDLANAHGTFDKLFVNNQEISGELDGTNKRLSDLIAYVQSDQGTAGQIRQFQKDLDAVSKQLDSIQAAAKLRGEDVSNLQARVDGVAERVRVLTQKIYAGQGTLGQFLTNPGLSESLDATTAALQGSMKDARAHPLKFFSIQVRVF